MEAALIDALGSAVASLTIWYHRLSTRETLCTVSFMLVALVRMGADGDNLVITGSPRPLARASSTNPEVRCVSSDTHDGHTYPTVAAATPKKIGDMVNKVPAR